MNLPLLAIVVAGTAFIAYWTLQVEEWGLMTDELLYVKLAQSFGDTLSPVPTVRGEYYGQFTPVYPLLIAPLLQVMDTTAAYKVAHGMNALLIASTAIPAYLLARDISRSQAIAYLVAAITVVLPWVVYANMLLTESAAYPVFVWTALAMTRAVAVPSPRRDAVAIAAIVVATLTRTQFALLGAVLVLAVLTHELSYRTAWARRGSLLRGLAAEVARIVRSHAVLCVAVALGVLGAALLAATGGVQRGAGAYGNTLTGDLLPHGISRSFRAHLAVIAANIAVFPLLLAVAWGLTSIVRPRNKTEHGFAVLLGFLVVGVVLQSASVNIRTIDLVQERYAFYIAPLLVIAAACYAQRPQLPWLGLPAGALLTLWVLTELDFALTNSYSFVWPFYLVLIGRSQDVGSALGVEDLTPGELFPWLVVIGSVALFFLFRLLSPGWRIGVVTVPVLAYCAAVTTYDFDKQQPSQAAAQATIGLDTPLQRDRGLNWVDDVLPDGGEAAFTPAIVSDTGTTRRAWWDVEFWNKSVVRMYDYEPAWRDSALPTQRMRLDPATGAIAVKDPMRYVVVPKQDRRLEIDGRPLAETSLLSLIEAREPLRARWAVSNTDGNGWAMQGKPAGVRVFASSSAGRVRARVQLTASPQHAPRTKYRITGGKATVSGAVARAESRWVAVPVCVRQGSPGELTVRVSGGAVLPGNLAVGLAVTGVRLERAGRCT